MRILGTKVDKLLTREEHIADVIKASYDTFRSLKFLKRYTPCKLRKTLAEVLMFSEIDNGSAVYQNVPKFPVKRLLKVQMISAGYVLNSDARECDVIKLGWLLIIERFEFNTTKFSKHYTVRNGYVIYLWIFKNQITELHLEIVMITNYPELKTKTFKSDVYRYFNDLPLDPRKEVNNKLISGSKSCFINKALARLS